MIPIQFEEHKVEAVSFSGRNDRSIRTELIFNNRISLGTQANGYMNRNDDLTPDIIDCEWEEITRIEKHWIVNAISLSFALAYGILWLAERIMYWIFN